MFLLSTMTLGATLAHAQEQTSPNIVVFIADDMGWEESSVYGNKIIHTPNMQRIANEGLRFDNFYLTASSSSPSRSSMLSGRYPHNTGAMNLHDNMKPDVQLFPELLKEAGYHTMLIGKSHGTNDAAVKKKFDDLKQIDGTKPWEMGNMWIDALNRRPKDKPFFLWAASIDPHRPYNQGTCPYTHKPEDVIVPPYLPDIPEMRKELAEYYNEIGRYDEHIGMVLQYLENNNLLDNTIILVISDNGRPFPQCKTRINVQGLKSPLIVRYPKLVKAGGVTKSLVSAIDLAPSILDIAGAKPLEKGEGLSFANILRNPNDSIRKYAFGEHNWHCFTAFERNVITTDYVLIKNWLPDLMATPPTDAVTASSFQKMWSLWEGNQLAPVYSDCFITPRDSFELFDIKKDIHCMNSLTKNQDQQERVRELTDKLNEWMKKTGDKFPGRENLKPDKDSRRTGSPLSEYIPDSTDTKYEDFTNLIINNDFEYQKKGVLNPDGNSWKPLLQTPPTSFYGWTCDLSILGNTSQGINQDFLNHHGVNGCWVAGSCVLPAFYEFYQIIDKDSLTAGTYKIQCLLAVLESRRTSQRLFANQNVQYHGKKTQYVSNLTKGEIATFANWESGEKNVQEMVVYTTIGENDSLKIGIRTGGIKSDGTTAPLSSPMQGNIKVDYFRLSKVDQATATDASLSNITLNTGSLIFSSQNNNYNVVLPAGTISVTPTAIPTVKAVNISGTDAVNVSSGAGVSTIIVTALDGITKNTYTINYTVAKNTGLNDIQSKVTYVVNNDKLTVNGTDLYAIYTLNGIKLAEVINKPCKSITLKPGFYVVKTADSNIFKIVVD